MTDENTVNNNEDINPVELPESKDDVSSEASKEETVVSPEEKEELEKKYTENDLDARSAKVRSVTQRRSQKTIDELNKKIADQSSQMNQYYSQYSANGMNNVPEGHVFDSVLGAIPNDMSREQYSAAVEAALIQLQQGGASPNANQDNLQTASEQPSVSGAPKNVEDQFYDCCVSIDDFEKVMQNNPVTQEMVVAAANLDEKSGMKFLYELTKKDPLEIYKLSRLNPDQMKMELIRKHILANETAKKSVLTNVPDQPKSLNGSGQINDPSAMTYEKRRAMYK